MVYSVPPAGTEETGSAAGLSEELELVGVVDEEEGDYLVEKIGADGQIDGVEKQLLLNIKRSATAIQSESLKKMLESIE